MTQTAITSDPRWIRDHQTVDSNAAALVASNIKIRLDLVAPKSYLELLRTLGFGLTRKSFIFKVETMSDVAVTEILNPNPGEQSGVTEITLAVRYRLKNPGSDESPIDMARLLAVAIDSGGWPVLIDCSDESVWAANLADHTVTRLCDSFSEFLSELVLFEY